MYVRVSVCACVAIVCPRRHLVFCNARFLSVFDFLMWKKCNYIRQKVVARRRRVGEGADRRERGALSAAAVKKKLAKGKECMLYIKGYNLRVLNKLMRRMV